MIWLVVLAAALAAAGLLQAVAGYLALRHFTAGALPPRLRGARKKEGQGSALDPLGPEAPDPHSFKKIPPSFNKINGFQGPCGPSRDRALRTTWVQGKALVGFGATPQQGWHRAIPVWPRPGITVLKPLHGDEPLLEEALASFCTQHYPRFQLVCGVRDSADPAVRVVERLRARFPACDIALVVNATLHGENRKIGNLINMLPAARHDVLLIGDSDVHAAPDCLARVADTLALPGTGLATTLYVGLPANDSLAARLGATAITHTLVPGVLLSRALGRQDCLGATMALRRGTLTAIGGLETLVHHLADDNLLGRKVSELGLQVRLAPTICATTVPETRLGALFSHELRWARTIQRLVPGPFAASAVQYPLAWAGLAMVLSGGAGWTAALFGLAWAVRAAVARSIDQRLGLEHAGLSSAAPLGLLPLRDLLSIAVMIESYGSDQVEWRGEILHTALDKAQHRTHINRVTSDSTAAD